VAVFIYVRIRPFKPATDGPTQQMLEANTLVGFYFSGK
jgi:hypothetical protein